MLVLCLTEGTFVGVVFNRRYVCWCCVLQTNSKMRGTNDVKAQKVYLLLFTVALPLCYIMLMYTNICLQLLLADS